MQEQCSDCKRFVRYGVLRCTECVVRRENERLRRERNHKALREMRACPWPHGACICGEPASLPSPVGAK